uniref:dentin sialophosphoprotein-like isoform X2 n=1 Tax=Myxine glutinosa TaxID=7769 RepID=UPI00358F77AC
MSAAEHNDSTQHYASQQEIEIAQQTVPNEEKAKKKARRIKFPKIFGKSKDKSSKNREKATEHDSAASPGNAGDQHGANSQPEVQQLHKKRGNKSHLPSGLKKLFHWRKKKKRSKTIRKEGTQMETGTSATADESAGKEKGQWQGFSSDRLEFLLEEILRRMENGGSLSQSTLSMASGYTEPIPQRMGHGRFQPRYRCGSAVDLSYGSAQTGDFSDHVSTMPNFHKRRNQMSSVSDLATWQSDQRTLENFRSMITEHQHRNPEGDILSDDDSDYECFSNGRSIEDLSSVMEQMPPEIAYVLLRKMKALDRKLEERNVETRPETSPPSSVSSSFSSMGRRTISPNFAKGPGVTRPSRHPAHLRLPTTEESSQEEQYYSVIDKGKENNVDRFENSSDRSSSRFQENAPSSPHTSGQLHDYDGAEMVETEEELCEPMNSPTDDDQYELESSGMSSLPRNGLRASQNTFTSEISEEEQNRKNGLSDEREETASPENVSTKLQPRKKRFDKRSHRIEMENAENDPALANSKVRNKYKNEKENYSPNSRHVTEVEVLDDYDFADEQQDSGMLAQRRNYPKRAQTPVNYESEEEEQGIEEGHGSSNRILVRKNANQAEDRDATFSARNNQPNAGDHDSMQDGPFNPPMKNQSEESSQIMHTYGDEFINHDEEGDDAPTDGTNRRDEMMKNLQEIGTEDGEHFLGDGRDTKSNTKGNYTEERFWHTTEDAEENGQAFQGPVDGLQVNQKMDEMQGCLSPIIEEDQSGDRADAAIVLTNGKGEIFYEGKNSASSQNKRFEFDKGTLENNASRGKDPNISRTPEISGGENLNLALPNGWARNEGGETQRPMNDLESPGHDVCVKDFSKRIKKTSAHERASASPQGDDIGSNTSENDIAPFAKFDSSSSQMVHSGFNDGKQKGVTSNEEKLRKMEKGTLLLFYGSLEDIPTESEQGEPNGLESSIKMATGGNESNFHQSESTKGAVPKALAPSDSVSSEQFDTKWNRNENVSQKDLKAKGKSPPRRPPRKFEQANLPKMKLSKVMPSTNWPRGGGISPAESVEELEDGIGPTESTDDSSTPHWPKEPNFNGQIATRAAIEETEMMDRGNQSDALSDGCNSLESDWKPHRQPDRSNFKTTSPYSQNEPKSMEPQQLINFAKETEDQDIESLPESWYGDSESSILDRFSTPDSFLGSEPDSPGLSSSGTQTIWLRDSQCQTPYFMNDSDEEHRRWTQRGQSRAVCWFIPVGSLDRWKLDESVRTDGDKEKAPASQAFMSPKQALQLHRPDFISHSHERQQQVKSIGRDRLAARMRRRMRDEQKIRMFLEWQRCGNDIEMWHMQEEELQKEHSRKKKEKVAKGVNRTKKEEKIRSRRKAW